MAKRAEKADAGCPTCVLGTKIGGVRLMWRLRPRHNVARWCRRKFASQLKRPDRLSNSTGAVAVSAVPAKVSLGSKVAERRARMLRRSVVRYRRRTSVSLLLKLAGHCPPMHHRCNVAKVSVARVKRVLKRSCVAAHQRPPRRQCAATCRRPRCGPRSVSLAR